MNTQCKNTKKKNLLLCVPAQDVRPSSRPLMSHLPTRVCKVQVESAPHQPQSFPTPTLWRGNTTKSDLRERKDYT